MKPFDLRFFTLALLGMIGLIGIGVGLGEASLLIISISTILAIFSVGSGFYLKKKVRKQEEA